MAAEYLELEEYVLRHPLPAPVRAELVELVRLAIDGREVAVERYEELRGCDPRDDYDVELEHQTRALRRLARALEAPAAASETDLLP